MTLPAQMMAVGTLLAVAGFVLTFTLAPLVSSAYVSEPQVTPGTVVANSCSSRRRSSIGTCRWPFQFRRGDILCVLGVRFPMTKRACYDVRSRICMEVALVFLLCVMAN